MRTWRSEGFQALKQSGGTGSRVESAFVENDVKELY